MSDIPPPITAEPENPGARTELEKQEIKNAIGQLKEFLSETFGKWTAEDWANAKNIAKGIFNGIQNIPKDFIGKMSGAIESPFFAAGYGLFIAVWTQFELTVEILIMRQLRLSPQEASIVCGGLSFGAKIHMLLSLLARNEKNAEGILLLKQAQNFADRNSFAHGFLYENVKEYPPDGTVGYSANLLKREVKYEYVAKLRPLDIKTMAKHVVDFSKQHKVIKKHFGISDDDVKAYQKSILDDALAHQSQAERRQQLLTNARIAKRKRRGLRTQTAT
jgi:hypothetical protein